MPCLFRGRARGGDSDWSDRSTSRRLRWQLTSRSQAPLARSQTYLVQKNPPRGACRLPAECHHGIDSVMDAGTFAFDQVQVRCPFLFIIGVHRLPAWRERRRTCLFPLRCILREGEGTSKGKYGEVQLMLFGFEGTLGYPYTQGASLSRGGETSPGKAP